jgi:OmpA-OmpF porin, OOP family
MKKIAIAALLSAVIAAPAVAADMYAGVNLGQTKYDISGATKNTATAFGILGGYTFNENFAAEAAYTSLGSVDIVPGVTVKGHVIGLSGVGSYPFNQQFSLFGKLGFARTTVEGSGPNCIGCTSDNKSGVTFGFGGQYNVSPTVGIRAGFDRYKVGINPTKNADVMSVGGVFKF